MTKLRAVTIAHAGKGNAGHALHRTFTDSAEVEMVALSDPDPAGRAKLSGECGARASYADYREMLAREKPDIVVIGRHYYDDARVEQFLAAVQSGAKGVFLEKPVAAWPDQAHRMLAAADAKGVAVALAHRSREHPTLHAVKRRADAGEWGPLMHVKGQGKGDQRTGTVDLLVLGTHVLDAMLFMLGANPVSCWGTVLVDGRAATRADATESPTYGAGRMAGNRLTAEYQFPNGVIGTYESLPVGDGAAGTEYLGADFYFQQAIVSTRGLPLGEFHVFPRGGIFPQADLGSWLRIPVEGWVPEPRPVDRKSQAWRDYASATIAFSNQVIGAELVQWIRTGAPSPRVSTIQHGVTIVEMIAGPQRAHLEGRRVDFPLKDRRNPWMD